MTAFITYHLEGMGRQVYAIPFNGIRTDNMVERDLLVLSDRLTRE